MARKGQAKPSAAKRRFIVGGDVSAMGLDYRAADEQPHAHAFCPRAEKAFEYPGELLRLDPGTDVFDGTAHGDGIGCAGTDRDLPVRGSRQHHNLHGIDDEVDYDLLELGTIRKNVRFRLSAVMQNGDAL